MIILNCEQRSDEWFEARAGIPTASNFDKIITSTGKKSKSVNSYAYKLAGETLAGREENIYTNDFMERGIELETEALQAYILKSHSLVDTVGLVYKDDSKDVSCSPDGLVVENDLFVGGVEIKCPAMHTHTEYLYHNKLPTKYVQQVQGSLYVTGLSWWDFVSYHPMLPLLIVRIYPDEKLHELLKKEVVELNKKVAEIVTEVKKR